MRQDELYKLLSQMTLEEKIGELYQIPSFCLEGNTATGPTAENGFSAAGIRMAGSCLSITGAKKVCSIQRAHIEQHPHHIPMLFMADIINGYRTVFPIPLAQGCTFDSETVEKCACAAANEAAVSGVHVTFSPMADLVQDARWGRVMESTGEDPYLNSVMSAAMVRGYQGKDNDLTVTGRIAACLKHFAGYGAPQGGRDYNTVELSERTLYDDYMPAYKAAIDAGCKLVMSSFNTLDRIPSSANRRLLQDILRTEMGFEGVVISDWGALRELVIHGIAENDRQAAKLAIEAGVDIDMASPVYTDNLQTMVEHNILSISQIDDAVLRVLKLKNELGLFENPFKDTSEEAEKKLHLCQKHRNLARKCAEESFVLLKNEGQLLPLKNRDETIAFIGPYVDNHLLSGSWSFFADDNDCVTVKDGILNNYPTRKTFFANGCPIVDPGVEVIGFQKEPPKDLTDPESALKEAVALAKAVDKVVLMLGKPRDYSGECTSRGDLTLPSCQVELLHQVCRVNPNICIVLFNGRPLDLHKIAGNAKAILEAWLPGIEGGNALARILFGDCAPSGKLAMSFPYCVGQVPIHYNHMNTGRPLKGDFRTERFSSQYLDIPNQPLFPFGFGLSYTTFSCSEIQLDKRRLSPGDTICASVHIVNIGTQTGTETVQLYIRDLCGSVTRPVRELKGFQRITLAPGEGTRVEFKITEPMLRFHDVHMQYTSEPGTFEVYIGFDSTTANKCSFTLTELNEYG